MTTWHILSDEKLSLYSPIGIRLTDDFTGRPPIGRIETVLDIGDGSGGWRPTEILAKHTLSGQIAFPRLERRATVVGVPPQKYRVRIKAQFYTLKYEPNKDGIEFEAFPYNDANPPMDYRVDPPIPVAPRLHIHHLFPGVNYPFPTYVPVLRGQVVNASGQPVPDVDVIRDGTEWTVSGERGAFALPLRWTPNGQSVPIDANNPRTNEKGQINITLPQALGKSQTIEIQ